MTVKRIISKVGNVYSLMQLALLVDKFRLMALIGFMRLHVISEIVLGFHVLRRLGMTIALATSVVVLWPSDGNAEAREADCMTTTAGSTTLLRPVLQPKGAVTSMVTLDLYGDHATFTHHFSAAEALDFDVIAPVSQTDGGPWPGNIAPGEFPSLVALAKGGTHLGVIKSLSTMSVARLVPDYVGDIGSFIMDDSPVAVQRLRLDSGKNRELWVVWTVPYLGDTYSAIGARDCSCGDPWNFALRMIGFAVDARQSPPSSLVVRNHTVAAAVLRQGTKEISLPPGERGGRVFAIGQKAFGNIGNMNQLASDPFSVMFTSTTWNQGEYPRTGLWLNCRSPQESEGAEGFDRDASYYARREKQLKADHAALRWQANCQLSEKKLPPLQAPAFLKLDGSEDAAPRRDWFIRGLARELLGGIAQTGLEKYPLLLRNDVLRRSPWKPTIIKSSSTLSPDSDRYQTDNLVDGNVATAWCTGGEEKSKGAVIEMSFETPFDFSGVAILPGYTKSDWLYEANSAPTRIRLEIQTRAGKQEVKADLQLPGSAELFTEGRDALVISAVAKDVLMVTLVVEDIRVGKFSKDLCISEIFFKD